MRKAVKAETGKPTAERRMRLTNFFRIAFGLLASTTLSTSSFAGVKGTESDSLKKKLTSLQYEVTQRNGTEPPFQNAYWNHHETGIYVDLINGEPLFSSLHKFDSGTGWPSFTRPISSASLQENSDASHGLDRTEVRSAKSKSHLGHVFPDGPKSQGGLRYCINSAALRFIPVLQLKQEGYGNLLFLFAEKMGWKQLRLAGGCYWGLEALLAKIPGVIETEVGKTQGAETVHLLFDPKKTSAQNIYLEFFRYHDPTTQNRQGNDAGPQYRSAIFVATPAEKEEALKAKARVEASGHWKKPLTTEITVTQDFQRDDEFHQKYLEKNPRGYTCHYARPFKF